MRQVAAGALIGALLAGAATAAPAPMQPASAANATATAPLVITYLSREQTNPSRASLLEPVDAHYGLQGAEFGLQEINNSGRFLGKRYELVKVVVPADGDLAAAARIALRRHSLIVADLGAKDLLTLADLAQAQSAVILDARTSDTILRQADCRANVFHLLPDWGMRVDAIGQYLAKRNWQRWFVFSGATPEDQAYAAAVKRSAARFGAQIIAEKTFHPSSDDPESSREQIQAQLAGATQATADYDVLFVADTTNAFGDYLLYNTAAPRLLVGTHGMVAEAWDSQFREYAARGVLYRFYKSAAREMTERDYGNFIAMAAFGDAVIRGGKSDAAGIAAYFRSNRFSLAANKGEGLSFQPWDQQLRQPLLLFGPRMLVAMAPAEGLGVDQQHSECRRIH